ncbi:MAG TPA: hypothetical protein DD723_04065 [Candidatus Omnitrophica bacterium]|nr:MAG: hypothetical protein A2Z81_00235 [Omnitrophica WOR_2 bacterium GWA2_45_18]OGX19621.1 MAG: hypothetical protein A2Y04_02780 [Omnitrophica WOR_2 bacterium GWC2_45_7]HBR14706.1 hypothetical protein [Candidatus Omnitrophota bacterium]
MRRIIYILIFLTFTGCATISVPNYIKDQNPYKKTYYSNFSDVLKATTEALEEAGWKVVNTSDPSVFEGNKASDDPQVKQLLLFTDIRQTSLFFATRYARINAYVLSGGNQTTELELRYITVTSVLFKKFYSYKKDRFVEHLLKTIEKKLQ